MMEFRQYGIIPEICKNLIEGGEILNFKKGQKGQAITINYASVMKIKSLKD